jgi:phospholipid/cholesterol/gamma-HCH transport system ATP-binding protein
MKKRAALARAMALNPRILFFDEPSAGLDPVTSAGLDELIIRFNRILGLTMVLVSHDLPSIFRVAHRVIMLDKQTRGIIAEGDPRYLREHSRDPFVRRFFNREPEE